MNTIDMNMFNNINYWNDNLLLSEPHTDKRQPKERAIQDTAEISSEASIFFQMGLDSANSDVKILDSRTDFNLEFKSSAFEKLTANGYYAEEKKELNLSLSYTFQKEEIVDGQAHSRIFEAKLSFHASTTNVLSSSAYEKKEDIMKLVWRLLNEISDISQDDDKKLGGVILDQEDFKEIVAMDDGKLAKSLYALIQMVTLYTNIMKRMEEKKNTGTVFLHPQREKYSGLKIQKKFNTIKDFHLEIKDITEKYQASGEQEEIEDTEKP